MGKNYSRMMEPQVLMFSNSFQMAPLGSGSPTWIPPKRVDGFFWLSMLIGEFDEDRGEDMCWLVAGCPRWCMPPA